MLHSTLYWIPGVAEGSPRGGCGRSAGRSGKRTVDDPPLRNHRYAVGTGSELSDFDLRVSFMSGGRGISGIEYRAVRGGANGSGGQDSTRWGLAVYQYDGFGFDCGNRVLPAALRIPPPAIAFCDSQALLLRNRLPHWVGSAT